MIRGVGYEEWQSNIYYADTMCQILFKCFIHIKSFKLHSKVGGSYNNNINVNQISDLVKGVKRIIKEFKKIVTPFLPPISLHQETFNYLTMAMSNLMI